MIEVHAKLLAEDGKSGEGRYLLRLLSDREIEVTVTAGGSHAYDKWRAWAFDTLYGRHVIGTGVDVAGALADFLEMAGFMAAGKWPVLALTGDMLAPAELAVIVPL